MGYARAPGRAVMCFGRGTASHRRARVSCPRGPAGLDDLRMPRLQVDREQRSKRVVVPPVAIMRPLLPSASSIAAYLKRIDESRIYSNYGPLWQEFHDGFQSWLAGRTEGPHPEVVFTSSGTTAIELALRSRALSGKRLCLMPSFTFIASAHAVCNAGLEPYLLDVDPEELVLTPAIAAQALKSLPSKPAAVLVVSAFGAPPDIAAWESFEAEHGVPVIIDAAAAATAIRRVTAIPICLSLHATKTFGIGEGGAIVTSDDALASHLLAMTGFGFAGTQRVSTVRGGNYRISEYTAAVGLAALEGIALKEGRLLTLAQQYVRRLADAPVTLQRGLGSDWASSTFNILVASEEVASTLERMEAKGVQWRRWWGPGTHRHAAFADLQGTALPHTEQIAPRVIGIPFHESLRPSEIDRVVACLS